MMHDDYWVRLATDPDFEAEMSERQRELCMIYEIVPSYYLLDSSACPECSNKAGSFRSARMASMDCSCK
jgi:hypothetical protein